MPSTLKRPSDRSDSCPDTPRKRTSHSASVHSGGCASTDEERSNRSRLTRPQLDPLLADEFSANLYLDVDALIDAFFPSTPHVDRLFDALCRAPDPEYSTTARTWANFPSDPVESAVQKWLQRTVNQVVLPKFAPGRVHQTFAFQETGSLTVRHGDCDRKLDVILSSQVTTDDVAQPNFTPPAPVWHAVRVIGELKRSSRMADDDHTLIQLGGYVREVFIAQPARHYVHAFTLCGSMMRVFLFDRAGAMGSTLFDIHEKPRLFVNIVTSYATFTGEHLGFDPTIKWIPGAKLGYSPDEPTTYDQTLACLLDHVPEPYVELDVDRSRQRFSLYPYPLFSARAVVSRGSVLWAARMASPGNSSGRQPPPSPDREDSFGASAPDEGIPPRFAPDDAGSVLAAYDYIVKDQWCAVDRTPEWFHFQTALQDAHPGLPQYIAHAPVEEQQTLEALVRRNIVPGTESQQKYFKTDRTRLETSPPLRKFKTRICMTPRGSPLYDFEKHLDVYRALRDAITGHRFLLQKHRILHRDVSLNNILLLPHANGGMLIDFDLAVWIERTTGGSVPRTGTHDWMAIELLENPRASHNYRHDLESFFWILHYLAMVYGCGPGPRHHPVPERSLYTYRNYGIHAPELYASLKIACVGSSSDAFLTSLLRQWVAAHVGAVLKAWRNALFPYDFKTDPDRPFLQHKQSLSLEPGEDRIYDLMLSTLSTAISRLEQGTVATELEHWDALQVLDKD